MDDCLAVAIEGVLDRHCVHFLWLEVSQYTSIGTASCGTDLPPQLWEPEVLPVLEAAVVAWLASSRPKGLKMSKFSNILTKALHANKTLVYLDLNLTVSATETAVDALP